MTDNTEAAVDVLLVARFALYPEAFDPEDGLHTAALVRFREWFDPWLAAHTAAAVAADREDIARALSGCRQFWRYSETGDSSDPSTIPLECNRHGVIPGVSAADTDAHVLEAWSGHLTDAVLAVLSERKATND